MNTFSSKQVFVYNTHTLNFHNLQITPLIYRHIYYRYVLFSPAHCHPPPPTPPPPTHPHTHTHTSRAAKRMAKAAGLPEYKCVKKILKKADRDKLDGKACPDCQAVRTIVCDHSITLIALIKKHTNNSWPCNDYCKRSTSFSSF